MEGVLKCPVCSDVIGVYEPVFAVGGSRYRRASLAREPQLTASEEIVVHHACAADTGSESGAGG